MIKTYYQLAKPGIIYGNALMAIGGFFLAAQGHFKPGLFLAMLLGICLVMASGCVFNNYIDRGIDSKMLRTKKRASVTGLISPRNQLIYGTVLGLIGFLSLAFTNLITVLIALAGWFFYVILYGIAKRRSVHGTIVGSIAGAVPPVVGYTAITGHLDGAAWLLFFILVLWQMPHFYAIAIFRSDDYDAAGLPVLPVKHGVHITKVQIVIYILALMVALALLNILGYAGYTYLVAMILLNFRWLWLAIRGFTAQNDLVWARQVFRFSLVLITALCIILSLNSLVP